MSRKIREQKHVYGVLSLLRARFSWFGLARPPEKHENSAGETVQSVQLHVCTLFTSDQEDLKQLEMVYARFSNCHRFIRLSCSTNQTICSTMHTTVGALLPMCLNQVVDLRQ